MGFLWKNVVLYFYCSHFQVCLKMCEQPLLTGLLNMWSASVIRQSCCGQKNPNFAKLVVYSDVGGKADLLNVLNSWQELLFPSATFS